MLRSERTKTIPAAREIAEAWKQAVFAKGGFTELGDNPSPVTRRERNEGFPVCLEAYSLRLRFIGWQWRGGGYLVLGPQMTEYWTLETSRDHAVFGYRAQNGNHCSAALRARTVVSRHGPNNLQIMTTPAS